MTEEKQERIAQIDTRLKLLSSTIDKHPEHENGLRLLYNSLMDERTKLAC